MTETNTDKMLALVKSDALLDHPRKTLRQIVKLSYSLPDFYGIQFRDKAFQFYGESVINDWDPALLRKELIKLIEGAKPYEEVEPETINPALEYSKKMEHQIKEENRARNMWRVMNKRYLAFFEIRNIGHSLPLAMWIMMNNLPTAPIWKRWKRSPRNMAAGSRAAKTIHATCSLANGLIDLSFKLCYTDK